MKFLPFVCLLLLVFIACTVSSDPYVGAFVRDVNVSEDPSNLYVPSLGLHFDGFGVFDSGSFYSYGWSGDNMTETLSDLPIEEQATNLNALLCHGGVSINNTVRHMKEELSVNSSSLKYYEPGTASNCSTTLRLEVPGNSVSYLLDADYIPLTDIFDEHSGQLTDTAWRGKVPFMGEDYYLEEFEDGKIFLDKGGAFDNVSNSGWDAEYNGYRFRVAGLITGGCSSILLDIRKPGGSIVQVSVFGHNHALVDDLEIAGNSWEQAGTLQKASIIVCNLSTEVVLQDGKDIMVQGRNMTGWKAHFSTINQCHSDTYASDGSPNGCDIPGYFAMNHTAGGLLKSVRVTYEDDLFGTGSLGINQSLYFPGTYRLTFKGYLDARFSSCTASGANYATYFIGTGDGTVTTIPSTSSTSTTSATTTTLGQCPTPGDEPPCGTVTLEEVVNYINEWSGGQGTLSNVVALINPWSRG